MTTAPSSPSASLKSPLPPDFSSPQPPVSSSHLSKWQMVINLSRFPHSTRHIVFRISSHTSHFNSIFTNSITEFGQKYFSIIAKGLMSLIIGDTYAPTEEHPDARPLLDPEWHKLDAIVKSCIYGTINPSLLQNIY